MQIKYTSDSPTPPASPLRKLAGMIATVAIVAFAMMFSAVLLVVLLLLGTIGAVFLWWKTRESRKQMRDLSPHGMAQEAMASNDEVFEGEVIRVVEPQDGS